MSPNSKYYVKSLKWNKVKSSNIRDLLGKKCNEEIVNTKETVDTELVNTVENVNIEKTVNIEKKYENTKGTVNSEETDVNITISIGKNDKNANKNALQISYFAENISLYVLKKCFFLFNNAP